MGRYKTVAELEEAAKRAEERAKKLREQAKQRSAAERAKAGAEVMDVVWTWCDRYDVPVARAAAIVSEALQRMEPHQMALTDYDNNADDDGIVYEDDEDDEDADDDEGIDTRYADAWGVQGG